MSEVELPIVGPEVEIAPSDAEKTRRPVKIADDVPSIFVDGLRFSLSGKSMLKVGFFEVLPFGSEQPVSRVNTIATMTPKTAKTIGRRLLEIAEEIENLQASEGDGTDGEPKP